MGYATILGLDLGKFKSVCCATHAATGAHRFETLATTPEALHDLLAPHAASGTTATATATAPARALLVIETCDAAGWVHDLAAALGVAVTVVHTQGDERWRWRKVKRKTDRDDALELARLARLGELPHPPVHVPSPARRQWRRLVVHRRSVVSRRTRGRNAIRSIYNQQGLSLARGNKQWTRAGLARRAADARPIEDCDVDDLWRGRLHAELTLIAAVDAQLKVIDAKLDELASHEPRVALLQTVRGVGPRLAEAVVLHVGEDPRRFRSGEHLASYAGLVPKQLASGQTTRLGHITGRGPALLRSLLVEPAWVVWRLNDWAQAFVDKVSRGRPRAAQAGDRRPGQEAAGPAVGHAQEQPPVPRARGEDARGGADAGVTVFPRVTDRPADDARLLPRPKGTHKPSACGPAGLDQPAADDVRDPRCGE